MKRCFACKSENLEKISKLLSRTVAGRTFEAMVPATQCVQCGDGGYEITDLLEFDRAIAKELASSGEMSAEAFRFMWRGAGFEAREIAELLDVTPETISRWSQGKLPIERQPFMLLASLVLDKLEGRTTTADRLRATHRPDPNADPQPTLRLVVQHGS